ncbi:MAG: hypothetical protein JWN46_3980 [Acidimicrobiales bacterium]|nr:hypothetical protein [Acidimicrobiales bacterium]
MSDAPLPPPEPPTQARGPAGAYELDVDITTFLPEGSELGHGAEPPFASAAVHPPTPPTDVAELERIELELAAVDRSLARLDDGTYGRCDACGAAIADDRLSVDPTATSCGAHG